MAFPTDWGRKCKLTIPASKVDANLTDSPVLLTEDVLPEEMFDADGDHPALNGGGDLRFSADVAGSTRLACEVVSFVTDNDPANGSAQIRVKIPSVSSSVNTDIYVWWEKAGETQPPRADTYGSDNAWKNTLKGVYHLEENSGDAIDSTGNANDLTPIGTLPNQINAKIGKGQSFDGTNDYYVRGAAYADDFDPGNSPLFTISVWVKHNLGGDYDGLAVMKGASWLTSSGNRGYVLYGRPNSPYLQIRIRGDGDVLRSADITTNIWDDSWHLLHIVFDDPNGFIKTYIDGSYHSQSTFSANLIGNVDVAQDFEVNRTPNDNKLISNLDEFRYYAEALTEEEISTIFNNENDPATFIIPGTPIDGTPGTPIGSIFNSPIFS